VRKGLFHRALWADKPDISFEGLLVPRFTKDGALAPTSFFNLVYS
jgi:hypothetical protein